MQEFFDLNYWKNVFTGSSTRKRLTENFFSLSILQVVNYLLPLITLPYLVRVLGPEKFGLIAFAQAFVMYLVILTDYGFNLSATREISINREDKEKVSEIFSSVIAVKIFLGILSFVILAVILVFIPKFGNDWLIYIFAFGMVLGNILFPVWFFQGMEKMKYITILNIVAKGIFTICIFIFIRKMADYSYVPLINSLGFMVAGGLSLRIVFKDFGVKFRLPTLESIKHQLKEGWHIFISTITASVYTISIPFITGLLTNNIIVGYYSAGEKIIRALEGLLNPLSQTIYPYISKLSQKSKKLALIFIKKLIKVVGSFTFFLSFTIFVSAPLISNIILGEQFIESITVIRILAFLIFAKGVGHIFLLQTMLNFKHDRAVFKIVIIAAVISIIVAFLLIPTFLHKGAAFAALIPEVIMLLFSAIFVEKKYHLLTVK